MGTVLEEEDTKQEGGPQTGRRTSLKTRRRKLKFDMWVTNTLKVKLPELQFESGERPDTTDTFAIGERKKLLSRKTLEKALGDKPQRKKKWNIFNNKKVDRYEAVDTAFSEIEAFGQRKLSDIGDPQTEMRDLAEKIKTFEKKCKEFAGRNKEDQARIAKAVKSAMDYARALVSSANLVFGAPGFDKIKDYLTLDQAVKAKRCGIRFEDFDTSLDDRGLNKEATQEGFGKGALNTVDKLAYQNGKVRVFKPEIDELPTTKPLATRVLGFNDKDPHQGNRNVASNVVGRALGTNVIPETKFVVHKGMVGIAMEMANGKPATETPWKEPPTPKMIASLHQQLNALEWTDMISGQVDRHAGNYLIDVTGGDVKITGIDNDLSFGSKFGWDGKVIPEKAPPDENSQATINATKNIIGLPKLIDRATFEKITAGDFDTDILPGLKGLLAESEIEQSRQRYNAVKEKVVAMDDEKMVVDDWSAWRHPDDENMTASQFLSSLDTPSLFKRDLAQFC
jgi:hypothetical protein